MPRVNATNAVDSRRLLVERVASSRYVGKSARLRDLLLYLCDRVLDDSVAEIHEQEAGRKVFGRPADYDTTSDNIVRVHASMLRKRLEQYFAAEGRDEPVVIEIPKGNYAPVFRERAVPELLIRAPSPAIVYRLDWRTWILAALAAIFASSTIFLLVRGKPRNPAVQQFWSQLLHPGQRTDIVLDDAAVGLYEELAGRQIGLSEYFDRSYLRNLNEGPQKAKLDPDVAGSIVLKRQSSYASTMLLWKLAQIAAPLQAQTAVHLARDYSFRELKANNAILLGNSRSNPWIAAFESQLGVRWKYDDALGTYYPVDTWALPADRERFRVTTENGEPREGYAMISFMPNLGGTGSVAIISGTGGAAIGAAGDFLSDEQSIKQLRTLLPLGKSEHFPYFEVLLRTKNRSRLPKDASIVICRPPRI